MTTITAPSVRNVALSVLVEALQCRAAFDDRAGERAAVGLLVAYRDGELLDRPQLRDAIGVTTGSDGFLTAWIAWPELAMRVDRFTISAVGRAVLRAACSLAGVIPAAGQCCPVRVWSLGFILDSCPVDVRRLIVQAVSVAAGVVSS